MAIHNEQRAASPAPSTAPLRPTLAASDYTDPAPFAIEREAIFARQWVCVGRADSITEPGAFVTTELAGESLLVVRGEDGLVRTFYNLCRHRGARLCLDDEGCLPSRLRCMYHGWTYALDGRLLAAPNLAGLGEGVKDAHGLHPVATQEWVGYVWVNLADDPSPMAAQLEPQLLARLGFLDTFARYGIGDLVVGRTIAYDVAANWKSLVENFTECYHCPTLHPELTRALPEFSSGYGTISGGVGRAAAYADGRAGFSLSGNVARPPLPGLLPTDDRLFYGVILLPNVFLILVADHVAFFRLEPASAASTRVVVDWLFDRDEVASPTFDPDDAVGLLDLTNRQDFEACERCQLGAGSRRFTGNLTPSEHVISGFYDWLESHLA